MFNLLVICDTIQNSKKKYKTINFNLLFKCFLCNVSSVLCTRSGKFNFTTAISRFDGGKPQIRCQGNVNQNTATIRIVFV